MRASALARCCSRGMAASSSSSSFAPTGAAAAGAEDWGLSMEELDRLEHKALQQVAARRSGGTTFGGSPMGITRPELLARSMDGRAPPHFIPSPKKKLFLKVSKEPCDRIGLKTAYDPSLIAAFKTVTGHEWVPSSRIWTYPAHRLPEVVTAVTKIPNAELDIQPVAPFSLPLEVLQLLSSNSAPSSSNSAPSSSNSASKLTPVSSPVKSQERSASGVCTPQKPVVVQLTPADNDRIVARNPYDPDVRKACQSVQGRTWNNEERVWTFPKSAVDDLLKAFQVFPHIKVEVDPSLDLTSSLVSSEMHCVLPAHADAQAPSGAPLARMENDVQVQVRMVLHTGFVGLQCPVSLNAAIKTIPRSFWSHNERSWMFPLSSVAEAEQVLASLKNVQVEPLAPIVRRALNKLATTEDFTAKYEKIPEYLETGLLPFQRDGVRFVLKHGGRVLIADEMGLGKTVQAIAVAACFAEDWPVLVIVPSSLRIQWASMLKAWLKLPPGDITVVLSQGGVSTRDGFTVVHSAKQSMLELDGVFNVISYDLVAKLSNKNKFKIVIADESHYLKNAQAKRTIACLPILQNARYAVLLTGTPALSRPVELFKQLEALQPSVYRDVHDYGQRYCSGAAFGLYQGSSNREELHALLKSTVMIRRLKREVLNELPEKVRQQVFLSLDFNHTKELRVLFAQLKKLRENTPVLSEDSMDKMKAEEKQLITKIYSESAVAKVPAVQEYLSTILETDCKILVFAHHQSMLDGIQSHLEKCRTGFIRIDGQTPPTTRQSLVTKFQEDEAVKVAVLSIRAAGVGLTLTASSVVIFAEMSWTPGDLVQAEDRAHRLGQRSSVNVYYLHAQDTVDDLIWDSVRNKLGNLGQVLDGREESLRLTPSPMRRQAKISSFLRPCSASSAAEGVEGVEDVAAETSDRGPKRCKLTFE